MKIKWQGRISNRELLGRANVERLSEEVRRRRWRFIGHILRQQPDNDRVTALTWTPKQGGSPGERCALQGKTGIDGEHMWRPYAPTWRQGTGEGEGEVDDVISMVPVPVPTP